MKASLPLQAALPYAEPVKLAAWSLTAAALLAACGGSPKPSASPTPSPSAAVQTAAPTAAATPSPEATVYIVKAGDTLSAIASSTHRSVDGIVKANNLSDPNKLAVGQKLTLPPPLAETSAPSTSGGSSSGQPPASPSGSSTRPPPP